MQGALLGCIVSPQRLGLAEMLEPSGDFAPAACLPTSSCPPTHPSTLPPPPPTRSSYLADAFQSHLQSNELLHEVFRFSPAEEPEERLTPLEKRLFRSKSSTDMRDRTEQRRKERATMSHYKHGSLADYA